MLLTLIWSMLITFSLFIVGNIQHCCVWFLIEWRYKNSKNLTCWWYPFSAIGEQG